MTIEEQLEAVRDRMADEFQDNDTSEEMWKDSLSYKAGFNAAIPIILKAVEQRDYWQSMYHSGHANEIHSEVQADENQELLNLFLDGGK